MPAPAGASQPMQNRARRKAVGDRNSASERGLIALPVHWRPWLPRSGRRWERAPTVCDHRGSAAHARPRCTDLDLYGRPRGRPPVGGHGPLSVRASRHYPAPVGGGRVSGRAATGRLGDRPQRLGLLGVSARGRTPGKEVSETTKPHSHGSDSGATASDQWAWVELNYRPHAYQGRCCVVHVRRGAQKPAISLVCTFIPGGKPPSPPRLD